MVQILSSVALETTAMIMFIPVTPSAKPRSDLVASTIDFSVSVNCFGSNFYVTTLSASMC